MSIDESLEQPRFTPKGEATRTRIIAAAADLFYDRGVQRTGNEDIRQAAGVSGSQLNRAFPDRRHLVRAVLARRTDAAIDGTSIPGAGAPPTLAALRAWADSYVAEAADRANGCRVGSLAVETLRTGLSTREETAAAFGAWHAVLSGAVAAMRDAGALDDEADPQQLGLALLGALQGGLLLLQTTGDPAGLRASLDAGLALVQTHARRPDLT